MGINVSPIRRVIAITASNGAGAVTIKSTVPARYVEIQECPPDKGVFTGGNFAPQGLNYQLPADNFTETFGLSKPDATQPTPMIILGDRNWDRARAVGSMTWTDPSGQACGGTTYCKIVSATTTVTLVEVREYL